MKDPYIILKRILTYLIENEGDVGCTLTEIRVNCVHRSNLFQRAMDFLLNYGVIYSVERGHTKYYYVSTRLSNKAQALKDLKKSLPQPL